MLNVQGSVQEDAVRVRGVRRGPHAQEHGQPEIRTAHEGTKDFHKNILE